MVRYDPDRHRRRSIRLRGYNYSTDGYYFVTTCVAGREPLFAEPAYKNIVIETWEGLPKRFAGVALDEFIIMPDHIHFVLRLTAVQGGQMAAPTLPAVIGTFKTIVASRINRTRDTVGTAVWQRNYYEHIVRDDEELARIRAYIRNNPGSAHGHDSAADIRNAWL